jgi:hypothetical protein
MPCTATRSPGSAPLCRSALKVVIPAQSWPDPKKFAYTFDRYAEIMNGFTAALGLSRYTLYMQDYVVRWVFAWRLRTRNA